MVARAGGYYGTAFRGERGVTQGDPLSPTIFNVVVIAVVRNWVNGLVEKVEGKGETGREGRHQSAVFYADDGMVVSLDPTWLQGAFNALVAIFDRVGLLTNVGKTVSIVCHPCWAGARNRTEEAYGRRLTGGRSYAKIQRERAACRECGEVLVVESMSSNLMTRHGPNRENLPTLPECHPIQLSLRVGPPLPVNLQPYAFSVRFPAPARQGWQTMLTVFPTLVSRPTL